VPRGYLHVAQVHTCVEHGGDEGVSQHVGVHAWQPQAGALCQATQPTSGAVPIHTGPATCQQDRPVLANVDSPFDGAAYGRREGHEHDLAALPAHPQHTVTVLLTQVVDVAAGGLKDAQPEKAQHGD
jgi:hypothetical protein